MNKEEQIKILLTKGVSEIFPNTEFLIKQLEKGSPLTIYLGFDPTAPSLHLGHAIGLRKLRQFQDLGHQIILLIGDFTAMIGDPDKLSVRTPLTKREILQNLRTYKKQASRYIRFSGKNKALVKFNAKWLSNMKFSDILSIASHMTVDQLLKREMFQRRMQEGRPVYLHEFMYPLMQGYDSVVMDVDGEIGGTDQMFNMLTGRTLLKQIKNKEKFVITLKLLEDATGKKMGKTEGNAVSLTDAPEQMYGKIMSWPDSIIVVALELCTDMTPVEIEQFLSITSHPKDQKARLAFEVVKAAYSEKEAAQAAQHFTQLFQKGEIPEHIPQVKSEGRTVEEIFVQEKIVASKSELHRLLIAGAVSSMITKMVVSPESAKEVATADTLRVGKNRFIKII